MYVFIGAKRDICCPAVVSIPCM